MPILKDINNNSIKFQSINKISKIKLKINQYHKIKISKKINNDKHNYYHFNLLYYNLLIKIIKDQFFKNI